MKNTSINKISIPILIGLLPALIFCQGQIAGLTLKSVDGTKTFKYGSRIEVMDSAGELLAAGKIYGIDATYLVVSSFSSRTKIDFEDVGQIIIPREVLAYNTAARAGQISVPVLLTATVLLTVYLESYGGGSGGFGPEGAVLGLLVGITIGLPAILVASVGGYMVGLSKYPNDRVYNINPLEWQIVIGVR